MRRKGVKELVSGRKYRLKKDLYGLRGRNQIGACVDHLVIDSEFTVSESDGERVLCAYGREYPLTAALEYDARTNAVEISDQ